MDFDPSQVWATRVLGASVRATAQHVRRKNLPVDWTDAITRMIELNTFASIWYWLAVIVTWSIASNWLIGVPFDMLFRARKYGAAQMADIEVLVDVNIRRIVEINRIFGAFITALLAFILSALAMMGFYYGWEFAQGMFILGAPLSIIVMINMRLAHQLVATPLTGRDLIRRLFIIRLWTQIVAMVTMFFTAMYGMYYMLAAQVFF